MRSSAKPRFDQMPEISKELSRSLGRLHITILSAYRRISVVPQAR
jgi:hypothetical protein